jgi:ribonuclease VapC
MVIDTSAILAILSGEPEAKSFTKAIALDNIRLMSAGTALEVSIVVRARKGEKGISVLNSFLKTAKIEIVDFDRNQLNMARYASLALWKRYG